MNLASGAWRKSSYSDGGDNNCVEVSDGFPGAVSVRDSKNPAGGVLLFPVAAWSAFMDGVKDGRLG
ncbi:DUF397 domain-containing protein [Streptomyces sp. Je 1-4]|uniref:DUF397 domain-containing protein n=1 Tax=Streptomyces TaxID=1883 RepID=UPI0021D81806|nr:MULTISPECIES: DUF397 domain-containing protein [unclassified Streptomyces]UYB41418.1 DUF397 domain-containing protein [Streptomyces sp. Je 1-4]UZQ37648.1 DUF397 domain-containing protein [Streptomyces sp. Je 1-4] [Streptomyces sp. Je 1-4 4N24]UZQ45065.1 DUF397 domain-containing protein [Streptomyces sp. Je 1-4] [Streptomyces sp. Je 1-4 4N24_ara]